jgi:hypothetical protein
MLRLLLFLVLLGIVVYALADLASADEQEAGGMPKWGWVVLIVLLPGAGAAGWLLFRRLQRTDQTAPGRAPGPRRAPKPVAPDDDPEFLWRLEQERRRREREANGGTGRPGGGSPDGGPASDGAGDNATP